MFVFKVWYCFVASSSKHVNRQLACSLLSILQQHCAVKMTGVTVVLRVDY